MLQALIVVVAVLVLASLAMQLVAMRRSTSVDLGPVEATLGTLRGADERIERSLRDELLKTREEASTASRHAREELGAVLGRTSDSLSQRFEALRTNVDLRLKGIQDESSTKLDAVRAESTQANKHARDEVSHALKASNDSLVKMMSELGQAQRRQLEAVYAQIEKLTAGNQLKGEELKAAVELRLRTLQEDNAKQLERMRLTVDEKLQGTLEKRLGESFKLVSERLEQVSRGLGEMQTLALGVGDLKKVLTNVKTRGTWGEVQLGALLEEVLTPGQYEANVSPKSNGERVEFAVKMPGRGGDLDDVVWLPIDAKFPIEDYQRLIDAQEHADVAATEAAAQQLELRIKACARDISEKYVSPPQTTDFAILFLPIEGLFAEVVRRRGLADHVQHKYRVVIAGPTTLWSLLSSLQMGFRTLAIQQRSSEVWQVLGAVKAEWSRYAEVLDKVKKQLGTVANTVNQASSRTRAIGRKLKSVEELPTADADLLLQLPVADEDDFEPDVASS